MTSADNELLKLIFETKAVSIWNAKTGPVFWYAASVPGPFYVNTELVIGPELATHLLDGITTIIANHSDNAARADALNKLILGAYQSSAQYRQVIAALVAKSKSAFPGDSFDVMSGGERRDWLFSIPLAQEIGKRHVFLFKNHSTFCKDAIASGERALHVADLINNAASYFDLWFPILEKADLRFAGTLCVNIRGTNGINRLNAHGAKTITLNHIDIGFFERSRDSGLIDTASVDEMAVYFQSPQEWGKRYLTTDTKIFGIKNLDKKSFERLQKFFTDDPWQMKSANPAFAKAIEDEIQQRLS